MNPFKSTLFFSTLLIGSLGAQEYRGVSEDFKLQLEEPLEQVQDMSKATAPMVKRMSTAFTELNSAIDKVKADPNALNKANFELSFAKFVGNLIRDVDQVVVNQEQMEYAFQDIDSEVRRVILGMNNKMNKTELKALKSMEVTKTLLKDVKNLAREMERKGDKATKDDIRNFKRVERQYKNALRSQNLQENVAKQYSSYLKVLGRTADNIGEGGKSVKDVYGSLGNIRSSLKDLAEARSDMTKISQEMKAGGILKAMKTIKQIQASVDNFNDISEKMLDSMDKFSMIDVEDPSTFEAEASASGDSWKKYLD